MLEPGIDRHEWESEWAVLEPLLEDEPAETLAEVDTHRGGRRSFSRARARSATQPARMRHTRFPLAPIG